MCVIVLIVVFISLLLFRKFCLLRYKLQNNVCVLVLGDLGRSPRMQYHALSFAQEGFIVDFIGYPGSLPLKEIRENPNIRIHYMSPPPSLENYLPRTLCYVTKTLWQAFTLFCVLFTKRISKSVIMQNPPAIPTMAICWFYCLLVDAEFVIDWHNYAYTIMALNSSENHFLVRFAKAVEIFFGVKAKTNFCVSQAMKQNLQEHWNIKAQVLYDRPADDFHAITLEEKHNFLLKLSENYDFLKGPTENTTVFTECVSDKIQLSHNRPGLIVSSTSWTEDEDFSILLNALQEYEKTITLNESKLPDLVCVITGKGPLKEFYMAIIELRKFKHVKIITPWLENEDYPKMLAAADLGICLHTSSSGLDLPMKVIDMFGCELPVCAYNFNCLSELVKHNENSLVFSDDKELCTQLKMWFDNFPNNTVQQEMDKKFREELHNFQKNRWHDNWICNVLPCFT